VVFFLIALLVVVADQLSKIWIRFYTEGQLIFEAGFFRLIRVNNTGAAFGLFQDSSFCLIIVDFIGIVLVLLYVFLVPRRFPFLDTKLADLPLVWFLVVPSAIWLTGYALVMLLILSVLVSGQPLMWPILP